ncbi:MAG TPA: SDR family oxidoreductase [Acidimicrobiales bacterium]
MVQDTQRLVGKVALVTGAARGTGAAIAELFVAHGARVILTDVRDSLGKAVAERLGPNARYLTLDVTSEDDWQRVVDDIRRTEQRLDVLVNNAAVLVLQTIDNTTSDQFDRVMRVNCHGAFLGTKACLPLLRESGRGSIVNVGSIDSVSGVPTAAAYTASKFALRGLTKVTALENGKWGVRANVLCPAAGSDEMVAEALGMTEGAGPRARGDSDRYDPAMGPLGRRGRPDDVAPLALFLASDESRYCTGAEFLVDGGRRAGEYVDVPGRFATTLER